MLGGRVDGALYEPATRIANMKAALKSIEHDELMRHFPVAAIATLEGYFRGAVGGIINLGSPYLDRGVKLLREAPKVADVVPALHRGSITAGELIAFSLPFNSVSTFIGPFQKLLECDVKTGIAEARDPLKVRGGIEDVEPIIDNVDQLLRDLELTFERRHVLAHEAAANYGISRDEALAAVKCVETLVEATDAVLWSTAWKNVPLTQFEMNVDAGRRAHEARGDLAAKLREGKRRMRGAGDGPKFRALHWEWRRYAEKWARLEVDAFIGGSMRPMVYASARERLALARTEDVESLLATLRQGGD